MPCNWEGNCTSGNALAMHDRFIHLRAQWPSKGDKHPPAYTVEGVWLPLLGVSAWRKDEWFSWKASRRTYGHAEILPQSPGRMKMAASYSDLPEKCPFSHCAVFVCELPCLDECGSQRRLGVFESVFGARWVQVTISTAAILTTAT